MDHLWSPWRFQFISEGAPKSGCVFCRIGSEPENDAANFVVHRGVANFVVLNLYPYTAGHMLIVPYEHAAALNEVAAATTAEMMKLTRAAESCLQAAYKPDGMNLGMNLGAAAGAGIASHIHMHILPRWGGDANFMSTIGETRVLPEELPTTWRKLKERFALAFGGA